VGAIAWTAPVIVDSIASPAAAQTCVMAITPLTNSPYSSGTDSTSFATSTFSGGTNGAVLFLAIAAKQKHTGAAIDTPTGGPQSSGWSLVGSALDYRPGSGTAGDVDRWVLWVYKATGNGGSATASLTGLTDGKGVVVHCFEATCATGSVVNFVTNRTGGAAGTNSNSPSVTFAAPDNVNHAQIIVMGFDEDDQTWSAFPAGFTGFQGNNADKVSEAWCYKIGTLTSGAKTSTLTGARQWGAIGFEVVKA
jgi:hypothetical protein